MGRKKKKKKTEEKKKIKGGKKIKATVVANGHRRALPLNHRDEAKKSAVYTAGDKPVLITHTHTTPPLYTSTTPPLYSSTTPYCRDCTLPQTTQTKARFNDCKSL